MNFIYGALLLLIAGLLPGIALIILSDTEPPLTEIFIVNVLAVGVALLCGDALARVRRPPHPIGHIGTLLAVFLICTLLPDSAWRLVMMLVVAPMTFAVFTATVAFPSALAALRTVQGQAVHAHALWPVTVPNTTTVLRLAVLLCGGTALLLVVARLSDGRWATMLAIAGVAGLHAAWWIASSRWMRASGVIPSLGVLKSDVLRAAALLSACAGTLVFGSGILIAQGLVGPTMAAAVVMLGPTLAAIGYLRLVPPGRLINLNESPQARS